jgi:type I restriction enzyme, S subunit
MSEWKTYKLGELVEKITKGTTPSTLGGGFVESGINFIKSEAVGYDGRIDKSLQKKPMKN